MKNYRRLLPSTSRLVAFAAVAETGSITAAAEALNLTQAAISRQLRELEDFIGQPLATRTPKGVVLTRAGQRLIADLPAALDQICSAVAETIEIGKTPNVTVFCDHSLTTSWLNRKVLDFEREYPEINIQVLSSNRSPETFVGQFDIAVLYGRPEGTAYDSKLIAPDRVFPVAAPTVIAQLPKNPSLLTLQDFPLIDFAQKRRDWLHWADFLKTHGIDNPPNPKLTFDSYAIAIEAARLGQGILLGWQLVLDQHLQDGSLQPVGPWEMSSPGGLRVQFPTRNLSAQTERFITWLCS
ncbi:Glycine cleavage system transcriptional activator [Roseovarius albus]|uniref:Glycine cleavage system transcriptional activator n=1 Tax=Roseovarius albus TaxID=1247867 RepID=A0A1X6YBG4_9RHOB|nr:LysR family transcriptional regulator [Roseovarius albus]SLN16398.1 Glycine cleavage system transcriptional activator [Roseovarius albus]